MNAPVKLPVMAVAVASANPARVDPGAIARHIALLRPQGDRLPVITREAGRFRGRHFDPRTEVETIVELARLRAESGGAAYYVPATISNRWNTGTSPEKEHVESAQHAILDVDPESFVPPDGASEENIPRLAAEHYARERERTRRLPEGVPQPSAVIFTGGGHQFLWTTSDVMSPDDAELVNRALIRLCAEVRPDHCHNSNRLLRLAGTWNPKTDDHRTPQMAEIVATGPIYYSHDLLDLVTDADREELARKKAGGDVRVDVDRDDRTPLSAEEMARLPEAARKLSEEGTPPGADRSSIQHRASCEVVRAGVADQTHFRWLLSLPCIQTTSDGRRRGGAEKYAERQVARAREEVAREPKKDKAQLAVMPIEHHNLLARDPTEIPARRWEVPGLLMRRVVTIISGHGGSGKSALSCEIGLGCALNLPFAGYAPRRALNVLFVNAEDDVNEMDMRLEAALGAFATEGRDVDTLRKEASPRLHTIKRGNYFVVAKQGDEIKTTAFLTQLEKFIEENEIGLLIFDPVVSGHIGLDENSAEMQTLHDAFHAIAVGSDIPVVIIHHHRKSGTSGDQNSVRGSGTLVNASRIVITVDPMSESEAPGLLENAAERVNYVKIANAKQNYGPKRPEFFMRIRSVDIGNGDSAPVLERAEFSRAAQTLGPEDMESLLDEVDAGREVKDKQGKPTGERARFTRNGRDDCRLDALLTRNYGVPKQRAKEIIKDLVEAKVIAVEEYALPGRKKGHGFVVKSRSRAEQVGLPPDGEIPF